MFIIPSLLELDEEDCPKLRCLGIQVSFIRITFICELKIEMSNVKNKQYVPLANLSVFNSLVF
jgi:hypothetical protein